MAQVLLIAGHGAGDPGACGCGYIEAEQTRRVAARVRELLNECGVWCEQYPIDRDAYQDHYNHARVDYHDYVQEIHFNAFNGAAYGTESLISPYKSDTHTERAQVDGLAALGFFNRGVKNRSDLLNLNLYTNAGVPYSLLEICFIDNGADIERFENMFEQVCRAIAAPLAARFAKELIEDMTAEQVREIATEAANGVLAEQPKHEVYNTVEECPAWARETVQQMVDEGVLQGDGAGLALSYDLLRTITIVKRMLDKAGKE